MVSPAFWLPLPLVYGDIHSSTGIASVSAGIAGHRDNGEHGWPMLCYRNHVVRFVSTGLGASGSSSWVPRS